MNEFMHVPEDYEHFPWTPPDPDYHEQTVMDQEADDKDVQVKTIQALAELCFELDKAMFRFMQRLEILEAEVGRLKRKER